MAERTTRHYVAGALRRRTCRLASGRVDTWYRGPAGSERKTKEKRGADGGVALYVGPAGSERLVSTRSRDNACVIRFEGPQGQEAMRTSFFGPNETRHYTGKRGEERVVRIERVDGAVHHFDNETVVRAKDGVAGAVAARVVPASGVTRHYAPDDGRLTKVALPDGGEVREYEGKPGRERLVQTTRPGGRVVQFFLGKRGRERKVKTVYSDTVGPCADSGTAPSYEEKFTGSRWHERKVKRVWLRKRHPLDDAAGTTRHYSGRRGEEYLNAIDLPDGTHESHDCFGLCAITHPSGRVDVYMPSGPDGRGRRLSEQVIPDGQRLHYEGHPGDERLCRRELPNGNLISYSVTDPRGQERMLSMYDAQAQTEYQYEGAAGSEAVVRTTQHAPPRREQRTLAVRAMQERLEELAELGHVDEFAFMELCKRLKTVHETVAESDPESDSGSESAFGDDGDDEDDDGDDEDDEDDEGDDE